MVDVTQQLVAIVDRLAMKMDNLNLMKLGRVTLKKLFIEMMKIENHS